MLIRVLLAFSTLLFLISLSAVAAKKHFLLVHNGLQNREDPNGAVLGAITIDTACYALVAGLYTPNSHERKIPFSSPPVMKKVFFRAKNTVQVHIFLGINGKTIHVTITPDNDIPLGRVNTTTRETRIMQAFARNVDQSLGQFFNGSQPASFSFTLPELSSIGAPLPLPTIGYVKADTVRIFQNPATGQLRFVNERLALTPDMRTQYRQRGHFPFSNVSIQVLLEILTISLISDLLQTGIPVTPPALPEDYNLVAPEPYATDHGTSRFQQTYQAPVQTTEQKKPQKGAIANLQPLTIQIPARPCAPVVPPMTRSATGSMIYPRYLAFQPAPSVMTPRMVTVQMATYFFYFRPEFRPAPPVPHYCRPPTQWRDPGFFPPPGGGSGTLY